jgi:hypothetical protein
MSIFGTGNQSLFSNLSRILDPGNNVGRITNLFKQNVNPNGGGTILNSQQGPNIQATFATNTPEYKDWRVKISLANNAAFAGPMQDPVFNATQGIIFPYTPTVTVTHVARYSEQSLTHTNYKSYFYDGSEVNAITINGEFTVQNITEGQYLLGAIYFLRSATKMFMGNEKDAGNPPPLVFLDGYGDFYFPHVSCVITNFTHTMPADVDYMEIPSSNSQTVTGAGASLGSTGQKSRLPTTSNIQVTLQPVYSRRNVASNFTLNKFARGELITNKGGFI